MIMKSREDAKKAMFAPKKVKKVLEGDQDLLDSSRHMGSEIRLKGMKRPLKPIPVFRQNPGESQRRFFNRMERSVQVK